MVNYEHKLWEGKDAAVKVAGGGEEAQEDTMCQVTWSRAPS